MTDPPCNFFDWYLKYAPPPILQNSSNLTSNTNCATPVYALINYNFGFNPPNIGIVRYYNIMISPDFRGNRIWNFYFGGYINTPKFATQFLFEPTCFVPNGVDQKRLNELSFNSPVDPNVQEPLQGFIICNNVNIPISENRALVNFQWNQTTTTFTLVIDLTKAVQFPQLSFKSGVDTNSIFTNLWIRDACLAPGSLVRLVDGSYKKIRDLDGSEILYYDGKGVSRIRFVVKKPSPPRNFCQLPDGNLITDNHPILEGNEWILPRQQYSTKWTEDIPFVYHLVLDQHESFFCGTTRCCSLGYSTFELEHNAHNQLLFEHGYGARDNILSSLEKYSVNGSKKICLPFEDWL